MMNKKIYLLLFFLSIEILTVGVLTMSNSLAINNNEYTFEVNLMDDNKKVDIININEDISIDKPFEKEFIIDNNGNVDALYDNYLVIGNQNGLNIDLSLDNRIIYGKSKVVAKLIISTTEENKHIDLGISLKFKELE